MKKVRKNIFKKIFIHTKKENKITNNYFLDTDLYVLMDFYEREKLLYENTIKKLSDMRLNDK